MLFFVHKVYMLEIGAKMMYNQLKQQNEAYHMKITEILNNGKINISCELFPPKLGSQLPDYRKLVGEMAKVRPSYMSVTYGATGGTSDYTVDIANEVQNVNNIPALAHLTCVSSEEQKVSDVIEQLKAHNINNILALRGDIPKNPDFEMPDRFHHASDLIYEIKKHGDFCIGGACYPEGHPEAGTIKYDIEHIKQKVDAGCDFLTTQMFFDNNILYNYMYKLMSAGINVPVVAGIMPITKANQLGNVVDLTGNLVPSRFKAIVDRFGDNPKAMEQAGIAYATEQIIDLAANGINNIHIYTMNRPEIAAKIMANLSEIRDK